MAGKNRKRQSSGNHDCNKTDKKPKKGDKNDKVHTRSASRSRGASQPLPSNTVQMETREILQQDINNSSVNAFGAVSARRVILRDSDLNNNANLLLQNPQPGSSSAKSSNAINKMKNILNPKMLTFREKGNVVNSTEPVAGPSNEVMEETNDPFYMDHVRITVDQSEEAREFPIEPESLNAEDSDYEELTETIVEIPDLDNNRTKDDNVEMSAEDMRQFQQFTANPAFSTYLQKLVAQEVKSVQQTPPRKETTTATATILDTPKRVNKSIRPAKGKGIMDGIISSIRNINVNENRLIKSPSDTTLYAPALSKNKPVTINQVQESVNMIDKISDFVEGIRMQSEDNNKADSNVTPSRPAVQMVDPIEEAKEKARELVIEAEQFKAAVNAPQGISNNLHYNPNGMVREDDEFFHLTCHVPAELICKIQRGEFVELEKLLPKPRTGGYSEEPKTELIFREGRPVIVPHVDKSRVITGIRRWEQAFRIYAAVYSQANPDRSAEIWQYVFIINTAATSYSWSNVAEYDFAFRQMIAVNPNRSWSKVYDQMWNVCLTDHLPNKSSGNGQYHFNRGGGSAASFSATNSNNNANQHNSNSSSAQKKGGSKYCWRFNKGKCRFGLSCRYINRCSVCDQASHGSSTCPTKNVAPVVGCAALVQQANAQPPAGGN